MTNQWGRGGTTNGRRSGNSSGMALAIVASLLIGAAGSYGYVRYTGLQDRRAHRALQEERDKLAEQVRRQSAELDDLTLKLMATDGDKSKDQKAADAEERKLQDDLARMTQSRDRLQRDNTRLTGELTDLQRQVDELNRHLTLAEQGGTYADEERARLTKALADAEQARDAALKQADALKTSLDDIQGRLRDATAERDEAREAQQRLQADLTRITAEHDAPSRQAAAEPSAEQPVAPMETATPRPADTVERVLERTPGLAGLGDDKRDDLKRQLVAGACVATALEGAFGRVPLVTLRNMIRDLQSDC